MVNVITIVFFLGGGQNKIYFGLCSLMDLVCHVLLKNHCCLFVMME